MKSLCKWDNWEDYEIVEIIQELEAAGIESKWLKEARYELNQRRSGQKGKRGTFGYEKMSQGTVLNDAIVISELLEDDPSKIDELKNRILEIVKVIDDNSYSIPPQFKELYEEYTQKK